MGKTSLEDSSSSTNRGDSSLAAPLLAAGSAPPPAAGAPAAAAPAAAAAAASSNSYTAVNTAGAPSPEWSSSQPRTPRQEQIEGRRSSDSTRAASAAVHVESSLMLVPLSLTPAIALDPHVQSIDLFANVKAYDHGQGCCTYLCSRCAPVFDWVSYLHAEALYRPAPADASLSNGGVAGAEGTVQQSQQQRRSTALFVDVGQAPAGAQATLLTLFGNRQLVFRAVQEVNRAYSNFWRLLLLVLLLLVLFLPGIGLLALLLIGCCSSLRKMCDDAVLQQMRAACEKADQRLAAWGVGLLLMEGYPTASLMPTPRQDLEMGLSLATAAPGVQARNIGPTLAGSSSVRDAHAAAALAAVAAAPSQSSRVWVLRVYMLPRRGDASTVGTAAVAATPAAHTPLAPSRLLSPSTSPPVSSSAPTSDSSAGALPAAPLAGAAASRTLATEPAAEASAENSCLQQVESQATTGTEQNSEKARHGSDVAEVLPQQHEQRETSPAQKAGVLPVVTAAGVKGIAVAGDKAVTGNEKGPTAVADVETATAATAATETAAEDRQLPQPRASTRPLKQREADSKKKRRSRKSDTKPNDMREPLLCQEENADVA